MFKASTVLWLVAIFSAALGLYLFKNQVKLLNEQVIATEAKISEKQKRIAGLEAEWAHMRNPERLADLSARFLEMDAAQGTLITTLALIPVRQNLEGALDDSRSAIEGLLPDETNKLLGALQSETSSPQAKRATKQNAPAELPQADQNAVQGYFFDFGTAIVWEGKQ